MIRATIERDGQMQLLKDIGANVLANACGPCIGQWSRPEFKKGEPNIIITSYNRNFPGRNDGRRETMNFIGSPELVIALALGGRLSFSPLTDELTANDGTRFKLNPPKIAPEIPEKGFKDVRNIYVPPADNPDSVEVTINQDSDRLQKLEPFPKWDGKDFEKLPILAKVRGVLALTFTDPLDYSKIMEDDRISIIGLNNLKPTKSVKCILHHVDGRKEEISLQHSYNESQLEWFRAGSALNVLHSKEESTL